MNDDQERKIFERWCMIVGYNPDRLGNDYESPLTAAAWTGWQARAALAQNALLWRPVLLTGDLT